MCKFLFPISVCTCSVSQMWVMPAIHFQELPFQVLCHCLLFWMCSKGLWGGKMRKLQVIAQEVQEVPDLGGWSLDNQGGQFFLRGLLPAVAEKQFDGISSRIKCLLLKLILGVIKLEKKCVLLIATRNFVLFWQHPEKNVCRKAKKTKPFP